MVYVIVESGGRSPGSCNSPGVTNNSEVPHAADQRRRRISPAIFAKYVIQPDCLDERITAVTEIS